MAGVGHFVQLATDAFRWASPNHPFAAHKSLREYMENVPKDKIGEPADRVFWLGEVLDAIRHDAAKSLDRAGLRKYDEAVAERMAEMDRPKLNPIPMLGAARVNPPRVFRPQKVVAELQKEVRPEFKVGSTVTGPMDLVQYTLAEYMGERATEIFLVLFVDIRNRIVGYTEYASGGVAGVEVNTSGILRDALASGAAAFITIHNHPSGDATPSPDDRSLWKRIRNAGDIVGVPCLDNLVVGENEYFSESEEGNGGLGRTKFKRGQL